MRECKLITIGLTEDFSLDEDTEAIFWRRSAHRFPGERSVRKFVHCIRIDLVNDSSHFNKEGRVFHYRNRLLISDVSLWCSLIFF